MLSSRFRNNFLKVLKFLQIKEGGHNFLGGAILQKLWIIWSPLLYFSFKSFLASNSSSFIRFQYILHDLGVLFSDSWNFCKLKRGDLISRGNQICRKCELFGPPFCIWIFKVLWTQILSYSLYFNAFGMIQEYFFSESWNFYKLKRGYLISGANQFCKKSELFRPPFYISILKI